MAKATKRTGSDGPQNAINRYWPILFFILLGLLSADLIVVGLRDQFLPLQAPPARIPRMITDTSPGRPTYESIISRNVFNSDGIIPDPLRREGQEKMQDVLPVPSSLPISLVGTLVHSNPEKSLAAIELKGKSQVLSFSVKQNIDNLAVVESIERGKVVLRNSNNGRLEFIELAQQSKLAFEGSKSATGGTEVKQVAEGQYEVKKTDIDRELADLPNLLMQARAVPARRPGTGETYGFRVLSVQPTSVLSKFVKDMDVITAVNGSPVTSIQQAMELYNTMKNSSRICMNLERDGRNVENCYSIK